MIVWDSVGGDAALATGYVPQSDLIIWKELISVSTLKQLTGMK